MFKIERVARELYRTSHPDGTIDYLRRYTVVQVPARPCSRHLHKGPVVSYLEYYIFTPEERLSITRDSNLAGGAKDSLPKKET